MTLESLSIFYGEVETAVILIYGFLLKTEGAFRTFIWKIKDLTDGLAHFLEKGSLF